MKNKILSAIQHNWPPLADILTYPRNGSDYKNKLELMDDLLSLDLPDEHPISSFIDLLGDIIDEYEQSHFKEIENLKKINASPIDKIKHLMREYNIKQKDLVDVLGSQGHVSKEALESLVEQVNKNYIPEKEISDMRGFLRGIDTSFEREADRQ